MLQVGTLDNTDHRLVNQKILEIYESHDGTSLAPLLGSLKSLKIDIDTLHTLFSNTKGRVFFKQLLAAGLDPNCQCADLPLFCWILIFNFKEYGYRSLDGTAYNYENSEIFGELVNKGADVQLAVDAFMGRWIDVVSTNSTNDGNHLEKYVRDLEIHLKIKGYIRRLELLRVLNDLCKYNIELKPAHIEALKKSDVLQFLFDEKQVNVLRKLLPHLCPNEKVYHDTLLSLAAQNDLTEIAQNLLERGAKQASPYGDNESTFYWTHPKVDAIKLGNAALLGLLIAYDPNLPVIDPEADAKCPKRQKHGLAGALEFAARRAKRQRYVFKLSYLEIFRYLTRDDCTRAVTVDGKSVLAIAEESKNQELLNIIEELKQSHLPKLPDEIKNKILLRLRPQDAIKFSRCNKDYYEWISVNKAYWKEKITLHFPDSDSQPSMRIFIYLSKGKYLISPYPLFWHNSFSYEDMRQYRLFINVREGHYKDFFNQVPKITDLCCMGHSSIPLIELAVIHLDQNALNEIYTISKAITNLQLNLYNMFDSWKLSHFAACCNQGKAILEKFSLEETEDMQRTPFLIACYYNSMVSIRALIELGANLVATDDKKNTFLHYAAMFNRPLLIDFAVKYAPNLLDTKNLMGQTPLWIAAKKHYWDFVFKLLKTGASFTIKDRLLFIAAEKNDDTIIGELLEKTAININDKNRNGDTALLQAAKNGNWKVVFMLLLLHADPTIKDRQGNSLLHIAVRLGYENIDALFGIGIEINTKNNQDETLLHVATEKTTRSIIAKLLDEGANIEARDKQNKTPLLANGSWSTLKVIEELLQRGANTDAQDNKGNTLAHYCVNCSGNKTILATLIDKNIKIKNLKNELNMTPLELTVARGNSHNIPDFVKLDPTYTNDEQRKLATFRNKISANISSNFTYHGYKGNESGLKNISKLIKGKWNDEKIEEECELRVNSFLAFCSQKYSAFNNKYIFFGPPRRKYTTDLFYRANTKENKDKNIECITGKILDDEYLGHDLLLKIQQKRDAKQVFENEIARLGKEKYYKASNELKIEDNNIELKIAAYKALVNYLDANLGNGKTLKSLLEDALKYQAAVTSDHKKIILLPQSSVEPQERKFNYLKVKGDAENKLVTMKDLLYKTRGIFSATSKRIVKEQLQLADELDSQLTKGLSF